MARGKRRKPTKDEVRAAAGRAEKAPAEETDETRGYDPLEPEETVATIGRPTKFEPEMLPLVQEAAEAGLTDFEIRQVLEISERTWYRWMATNPEFRRVVLMGRVFDQRVERALGSRAVGYSYEAIKIFQNNGEPVIVPYTEHVPPDVAAGKFWLTNRDKKNWSDTQRSELTGKDGGPIETKDIGDTELARRLAFIINGAVATVTKIKGKNP